MLYPHDIILPIVFVACGVFAGYCWGRAHGERECDERTRRLEREWLDQCLARGVAYVERANSGPVWRWKENATPASDPSALDTAASRE